MTLTRRTFLARCAQLVAAVAIMSTPLQTERLVQVDKQLIGVNWVITRITHVLENGVLTERIQMTGFPVPSETIQIEFVI